MSQETEEVGAKLVHVLRQPMQLPSSSQTSEKISLPQTMYCTVLTSLLSYCLYMFEAFLTQDEYELRQLDPTL